MSLQQPLGDDLGKQFQDAYGFLPFSPELKNALNAFSAASLPAPPTHAVPSTGPSASPLSSIQASLLQLDQIACEQAQRSAIPNSVALSPLTWGTQWGLQAAIAIKFGELIKEVRTTIPQASEHDSIALMNDLTRGPLLYRIAAATLLSEDTRPLSERESKRLYAVLEKIVNAPTSDTPDSRTISPGWGTRAHFLTLCGALLARLYPHNPEEKPKDTYRFESLIERWICQDGSTTRRYVAQIATRRSSHPDGQSRLFSTLILGAEALIERIAAAQQVWGNAKPTQRGAQTVTMNLEYIEHTARQRAELDACARTIALSLNGACADRGDECITTLRGSPFGQCLLARVAYFSRNPSPAMREAILSTCTIVSQSRSGEIEMKSDHPLTYMAWVHRALAKHLPQDIALPILVTFYIGHFENRRTLGIMPAIRECVAKNERSAINYLFERIERVDEAEGLRLAHLLARPEFFSGRLRLASYVENKLVEISTRERTLNDDSRYLLDVVRQIRMPSRAVKDALIHLLHSQVVSDSHAQIVAATICALWPRDSVSRGAIWSFWEKQQESSPEPGSPDDRRRWVERYSGFWTALLHQSQSSREFGNLFTNALKHRDILFVAGLAKAVAQIPALEQIEDVIQAIRARDSNDLDLFLAESLATHGDRWSKVAYELVAKSQPKDPTARLRASIRTYERFGYRQPELTCPEELLAASFGETPFWNPPQHTGLARIERHD